YVLAADPFDRRPRELLQPGHERHWNGHPLAISAGTQEDGMAVARRAGRPGGAFWPGPRPPFRPPPPPPRPPQGARELRPLSVAHDGRRRARGHPFQLLLKRLDDDFLGVVNVIDNEAKLAVVRLKDDNVDLLPAVRATGFDAKFAIKVYQWEEVAAEPINRR